MPTLDPEKRLHSWNEVAQGFSEEQAQIEASRCLHCKQPVCVEGCPVHINIPEFIKAIQEGRYDEGFYLIKEQNTLPAICGRVCPQSDQCEKTCILGQRFEPVAIGALERFLADHGRQKKLAEEKPNRLYDREVVVVGSGPAGLTAAADLARYGYHVTLYEALHDAGGVLRYGIPEFRLPKNILEDEIHRVETLGVKITVNHVIGKILSLDEILENGAEAIFIGTGAGLPKLLNIEGMNLSHAYSANEFLTRVNLMKAYKFPEYSTPVHVGKITHVIGGGNVALDSARVALRLKSDEVNLLYRRTTEEMPARTEEIEHAVEEGVNFQTLAQPVSLLGDNDGFVTHVKIAKCRLGKEDDSGRRRPIVLPDTECLLATNTVVFATGQNPNPLISATTKDLKTNKFGGIAVDPATLQTSRERIYAGGDIVSGAATVILAMEAGKLGAASIHQYLQKT